MYRPNRWTMAFLLTAAGALVGAQAARAEDPAPEKPRANAPADGDPSHAAESRVMLTLMKATGRVMLAYLDEKQDPEKAAAYEDVFRALGGVMSRLDPADERAMAGAGMKAMLELMPTMKTPKRAEVMRGVLMTLMSAAAEGMEAASKPASAGAGAASGTGARALGDALLGGLADGLLEEVTGHAFGGVQLAALAAGREGFPVVAVRPGSRAERSGLRVGDSIVRFGDATATWGSLVAAARSFHRDGDFPALTVLREGKRVELSVPKAAPRPGEPAPAAGPR